MIAIGQITLSTLFDGDSYIIQPSVSSVVIEDSGNYSPSEITLNNKHKQGNGTLEDYSGRLKIETTLDNNKWETQYTSSSDEVSKTYALPSHISDSEPYHYRKTPVASAGSLDEKIVGGTLAWNQLVISPRSNTTVYGLTITKSSDGHSLSVSGTASSTGNIGLISSAVNGVANHIYIASIGTPSVTGAIISFGNVGLVGDSARIYKPSSNINIALNLNVASGSVINMTITPIIIDLTTLFGSTIADYIYSLEQATAGAGVDWVRQYIDLDTYHEYCEPILKSVEGLQSRDVVGFNQWDEEWEVGGINHNTGENNNSATNLIRTKNYIKCIPATSYFIRMSGGASVYIHYYDANKNYLKYLWTNKNTVFTTPDNAHYIRFHPDTTYGITYKHDICINISDPAKNGIYEPYEKHSYPLDSDLELRGIPKLSDGKMYFDGDEYSSDGQVVRRFFIHTWDGSSDESITLVATQYRIGFRLNVPYARSNVQKSTVDNIFTNGVKVSTSGAETSGIDVDIITFRFAGSSATSVTTCYLTFPLDVVSSVEDVRTYLSNHPLTIVYELATPTTETATPFQSPMLVGQTEEYVSDGVVPVGHESKYITAIKNVRASLYKSGGTTSLLDQITIPVLSQEDFKPKLVNTVRQYAISNSATALPSNPTWIDNEEPKIGDNEYMWGRLKHIFSDGTFVYSDAVCSTSISGAIHDVDKANKSITDKVWESDITTKINSYDNSTVSTIRDRVSQTETDIDGITSRVSDVESVTDDLGTRMSTAETTIDQTANNVLIKATKSDTTAAQGGQHLIQSLINVAPSGVTISADKVNIEGATIFSSGRLSQTSLNNAYAGKSTALSDSIPIYYRSPSSTTPTISASTTIGTSNNTDNSWTYVMPIPKRNSYFFTCERQVHPDGSVTFSTVRPLDSQTYASKWVSSADNTYIDGGRLYAHSVTTGQLATDAIKSTNYQAAISGPYSVTGTFLDLSNGNFYTPNFGVQSLTGQAYLNGEIIATSGSIGDDSGNYWSIGNTIDSQGNGSASIVGNGTAFIQDGDWQIHSGLSNYSNGSINTQWYIQPQGQGLQLTYPYYDGYYYDYGMTSPVLDANADRFYNQTVSQNFLYIRKHASTIPALESDWNYIFRVDKDGMIWINGQSLTQMIQSGVDGGAYLPTSGGTVNGNVTITGTLTATASKANQLTHTLSINGKGFDGSGDVNVGTIGAAYGGTGQTSLINSANALLNALSTGSDVPKDNDYYISQYVNGGTSTTTYHRRPVSKLWDYIKSKLSADHSALDSSYVLKSGDTITGSLTVENGIYSDSAQLGDLIVTGAGRFANGLYGNLIGNADTATKAAKVADSGDGRALTISINHPALSTTSWIAAWNGNEIGAISPTNLLTTIGGVAKSGDTMTGTLTAPEFSLSGGINNTIAGFRLTNNGTNMDMGWTWTGAQGAGACFTSSSHSNQPGIFDFFARAKNSSDQEVTKHLVGNISGVLTWDDRRVVTATNSTAVGGTSTPIYIDANGYAQACTSISATSATKATQDADGNTISSTYLKLSGGTVTGITQFNKTIRDSNGQHYFGGAANRTQWYVITLAHNGVTPPSTSAQWYMCSMSIHLAGDYQNAPNGTIELSYYIYWDKTEFHAINVYATGYGPNINKVNIYYNLTNPFILYVDAANAYTTIWVDRVSYRDSAQSHNTKETKVQQSAAITVDDYSQVPIASIHTYNGTHLTTNSTFYPDVDNTHNLGTSDKKWSHVYATTFNGNLSGNASSASKLNSTRSFTVGNTAKNVDWSGAVSFSKAEISDDASSTANGWMSVADKKKLDSITVSDIGTIGANSIRGEKDIKVTISSGIATIGHENAAITAGTISGTATSTLSNGGSFKIPSITYDAYGHITGTAQTTVTLPNITSVSGNAGTATKFSSARAISLSGDVSGTATADGSSGWSIGTLTSKLTPVGDNRSVATTPNDYNGNNRLGKLIFQGLKNNGYIDSPSTNTYSYLVGLRGWTDSSGGKAHELAFNNAGIFTRMGSTTTWDAWRAILDSSNFDDYALPLTGGTLTGDLIVGTTDSPANIQIGAKNDNYGLLPSVNNYNQIGKSGMSWYRAYISNYYGANSMVTNWRSGNNIGYPSTSSANAERGKVNFYNDCTAGSTQTKTLLEASASATSNITLTLPNKTGTIALTSDNVASATTATYSYYTKFVASNEIRFDVNTKPSSATTLCVGYKWSDATTDAKINRYAFYNGASALAEVAASTFYGDLSGNATSATKASQDGDGNTISSTYLKLSGGTMTGAIMVPYNKESIHFSSSGSTYGAGFIYGNNGNETLALSIKNAVTSFMVVHGSDPTTWNGGTWYSASPTIQTKYKSLYVNELIAQGVVPSYNFKVNGTSYLGGEVKISDTNADTASVSMIYDRDMQCLNFIFN